MSTQIKWRLENPQVGQEVAIYDKQSGEPYRITKIGRVTATGRVRTIDPLSRGNLFEVPYGYSVGYSQRMLTNDPTAISLCRQNQLAKAEAEAKRKAEQETKEADPRWPVSQLMGFFQTEDDVFKALAVLNPDELIQLKTLLEKVYK